MEKVRTFRIWLVLGLVLSGCATTGPVAVKPDQPFHGVADLLGETPSGGSLNLFLVHGMRADADQNQVDLRTRLSKRLNLTPVGVASKTLLGDQLPNVMIADTPVWPTISDWRKDLPYLDIARYDAPGGKQVVFYSLNYWRPLARIKCRELIRNDTYLLGPSDRSRWCAANLGEQMPDRAQSTQPLIGNKWLKAEIMDWGFGDAALVMSPFERIIRAAVREGAADAIDDVALRLQAAHHQSTPPTASAAMAASDQRFAVITESLGGFVVFDTLATPAALDSGGPGDPRTADAVAQMVCQARQFHMLANQVSLLRFSRMRIDGVPPAGNLCGGFRVTGAPAMEVVAYHDPNDELTFYNPSSATEATLGVPTINVVAPFAPIWIWFLVADPNQAHDGQQRNERIVDLVTYGRHAP